MSHRAEDDLDTGERAGKAFKDHDHNVFGAAVADLTETPPLLGYLATTLLLDRLKESAPARIITTASEAHQGAHIPFRDLNAERSFRSFGRYGETKLANILFTR